MYRLCTMMDTCVLLLLFTCWCTVMSQCPNEDQCSCDVDSETKNLILNCRGNGLTDVPTFTDTTYQFYEITLHGNSIKTIGEKAFYTSSGEALKVLRIDLGENPVTSVHDDAFKEMDVEELVLHMDSSLTELPTTAINSLAKLKLLEIKGITMESLPPDAFVRLTSLKHLVLHQCSLNQLNPTDLTTQVNILETLDLEGNKFTSVPKEALDTLTGLKTLKLNKNDISGLASEAIPSGLIELDLSQNGLASINPNAFSLVSNSLKTLQLSYTGFHDTSLQSLSNLIALQTLVLNNNDISQPPLNVFTQMKSLSVLNLHACKFRELTSLTFNGLQASLTDLDLVSNSINLIEIGTFQGFSKLQKLHLNLNDLQDTMERGTFLGLESGLKYLSLEGTDLITNNLRALSILGGLETLKLNGNQISSVPDFIFSDLSSLEVLEMNGNQLTAISPQSMRGLQNSLKTIDLNSNQIRSLSNCLFHDFTVLETIKLDNNPLLCDCHSRWLKEWLDQYDEINVMRFKWKCAEPDVHQNKYLRNIEINDLVCDNGEDPEENCAQYTSLPSTTTVTTTTNEGNPGLIMNISDTSDTTITIHWETTGSLTGLLVEITHLGATEWSDSPNKDKTNITATGLEPETEYDACVTAFFLNKVFIKSCEKATTLVDRTLPLTDDKNTTAIIVGSIVGIVALIIVIIIVVVFLRRTTHEKPGPGLPNSRSEMPTMGYNSKRFSKPKPYSLSSSTYDIHQKLESFSEEERNRILKLLASSTLSMVSNDSQRYLQEPQRWSNAASYYPNYNEYGHYQEIPIDKYDYIPADQINKYDYIPADQVQKPGTLQPSAASADLPPPVPGHHPTVPPTSVENNVPFIPDHNPNHLTEPPTSAANNVPSIPGHNPMQPSTSTENLDPPVSHLSPLSMPQEKPYSLPTPSPPAQKQQQKTYSPLQPPPPSSRPPRDRSQQNPNQQPTISEAEWI